MKITRSMVSKRYLDFIAIYGYMVSGVSPAAGPKKAGLNATMIGPGEYTHFFFF